MSWLHIFWDVQPGGNAEHVADHGLDIEDVEHVLRNPEEYGVSRSSGRPMIFGRTPSGERIVVVYEELDEDTVYPVTAYAVEE
jgi:uncharacterized DUF497 family protein